MATTTSIRGLTDWAPLPSKLLAPTHQPTTLPPPAASPLPGSSPGDSPAGQPPIGANEDNTVTVDAPRGAINYTVRKIER